MYLRASYLKKIQPFIGKPVIKVITGMRRTGKSYFVRQLIEDLKKIIDDDDRCVARIHQNNILPSCKVFYEEKLSFEGMKAIGPQAKSDRIYHRAKWVDSAHKKTNGLDIVFIDPDNGLQVKSVKKHHKKGPKYAFFDELKEYVKRKQTLKMKKAKLPQDKNEGHRKNNLRIE